MAFTAGFSVNVGDPTKASDVDVLAANDDYLKNAIDTFIANDANNRVLTATGSGTANAESNLTFDGSTLTVTGTGTFSGAVNANNLVLDASGNYPILLENQAGTTADAAISTYDDANGTLLALGSNFYFSSGGSETRFNTSEEAAGIVLNRTGTISFRTSDGSNNTVERVSIGNTGDLAVDTDTLFVDASASAVGISTVSPDGTLHVHTASAGSVTAHGSADDLVVESSADAGLSILTPAANNGRIYFGSPTNNAYGQIDYDHATNDMVFATAGSGKLTIDSAGNAGISTSSPVALSNQTSLTINGTSVGRVDVKASGGGGGVMFGTSSALTVQANSGVAINIDSASGQPITFQVGSSDKARIDASGNMALGVTPSAWRSTETALQVGLRAALYADSNVTTALANNLIINSGGYALIEADAASQYYQYQGAHVWQTVGSGSAGANVSPSTVMSLTSAGNLGLGTSSPTSPGSTGRFMQISNSSGSAGINLDHTTHNSWDIYNYQGALGFYDETATRMTLTSTGLGIGAASPSTKIHASGASSASALRLDESTSGANSYLGYLDTSGNFGIDVNGGGYLRFAVGGAERARITSAGLFEVTKSGSAEGLAKFESNDDVSVVLKSTYAATNGAHIYLEYEDAFASATESFKAGIPGGSTNYSIGYGTIGEFVSSQNLVSVTSAGLVGIGTSSPSALLHLYKNGSTQAGLIETDQSASVINFKSTGQTAGQPQVGCSGSNLILNTNGTERARITSGGNVGIGSQSPTYKLVVSNGGAAGYEFNVSGLNGGVNTVVYNRSTSAYVDSAHFVNNYYIYSGQTPAERFRVESTGVCAFMTPNINIRFNGTATQSVLTNNDGVEIYTGGYIWAGRQAASLYLNRAGTTGDVAVFYYNNTTAVGSISVTSSATAYNTSSDYRLKENLVPITDAVDRVNALQPRRFNFISDPDTTVDGFVAHEVSSIVPEAISGEKDAVDEDGNPEYQGIDQSKLVPLLTAAIQELTARIEALEAA